MRDDNRSIDVVWMMRCCVACLAGVVLPFAFAPHDWSYLAVLAPAMWLLSLNGVSIKRAVMLGFLFGVAYFGVGVSWIYISIHHYGEGAAPLAGIVTFGFITLMASYFMLQAYILNRFYPSLTIGRMCVGFPATWLLAEYVRAHFLTGFPWLLLGYSQTHTWFAPLAPMVGVYGVGYAVNAVSGALVMLGICGYRRRWRGIILYSALLASVFLILFALRSVRWTHPLPKAYRVALVQGNIKPLLKWSPDQLMQTIATYRRLTMNYLQAQQQAHIIVWPEAAIPLPMPMSADIVASLARAMRAHHSVLITGIPEMKSQRVYYNAVLALGEGRGRYEKRHLVPFGEYIPGRTWFGSLFDILHLPMSDFQAGKQAHFLYALSLPVAPFICYEIAYSDLVRAFLPKAQLLLTITDDAWFGDSWAQAQHLQIAEMQSLQTGRYQLFASNNASSAIINAQGDVIQRAPRFQTSVVSGDVYAMLGATLWVRWGDMPWLVLCLVLLGVGMLLG